MTRFAAGRPGGGFLLLLFSLLVTGSLSVWALRVPELERVWGLSLRLASGERLPLATEEFALLQSSLARHPQIARELLGGGEAGLIGDEGDHLLRGECGYVLVTAAAGARAALVIELVGAADARTAEVSLRTASVTLRQTVSGGSPWWWRPQGPQRLPQLIEIRRLTTNTHPLGALKVRLVTPSGGRQ
jgi:hypothetical protein